MKNLTSTIFINTWKEFSDEFTKENPNWLKAYQKDGAWSDLLLKTKSSDSEKSPIGKFFNRKHKLKHRTEDGSFDIALSSANKYRNIPYICEGEIYYYDIEKHFYPVSYDVIIEVENKCHTAWHEMTKLTWVRCPLKVLITYNSSDLNDEIIDLENKMLMKSFSTIIEQSNNNFPDNPETEYLLIVGNAKNDHLNWKYFKFDSTGKGEEVGLNK